jgi:glycosyltransferase involved in cell wall biosynthesis
VGAGAVLMRIAVCHPQVPFIRGGAETHTESVVRALRAEGHDAEIVAIPWKWYPPPHIVHSLALWRSLDLSESNGLPIDAVIALKFPAYAVQHDRKLVWLIHQHRSAYELWDHPEYGDLAKHGEEGVRARDVVRRADRVSLGEAKRIFTNSRNVSERLRVSLGIEGEPLYHPSPIAERLLEASPGPFGDYLLFPSRFETLKRQALVIEAMRHVRSGMRLILVGRGPDEESLRALIDERAVASRVTMEVGPSDERVEELYLGAFGVYNGPFDEDYGYVTIEGFAARRPVLTLCDSGGPLEFVEDDRTGIVSAPDAREIAAAIDRLAADEAAAKRMGAAGHAEVRERVPGWPEIVARLLGS